MLTFTISPSVLDEFPTIAVRAMRVQGLRAALREASTSLLLASAASEVKKTLSHAGSLNEEPSIAEWRAIYRRLGLKPSEFRSSIEALVRRAVSDKKIETGVPIVDFYNSYSLAHLACMGGYDVDKLDACEIWLRHCKPEEDKFYPLGGKSEDFPMKSTLVSYTISNEICCWALNCRDSIRTSLSDATDHAIFFAEGITSGQIERAKAALDAMSEKFEELGARVMRARVANAESAKVNL